MHHHQTPVLSITWSLQFSIGEGPQDPITEWKYTQLHLLGQLVVERFFLGGGKYILASPGKGVTGGWLKYPIRKIQIVPIKNTDAMTIKQTLSITRATRNHSSFSWIKDRFPVMFIEIEGK